MKLQFISQGLTPVQNLQAIKEACAAGCDWVQLRIKNISEDEYVNIARKALQVCNTYKAKLIINDSPNVALAVRSYGLHLGKEDMSPSEARRMFDYDVIIGGTANTWDDIQRLAREQVDYIGLGPFRFTSTKKKLSPTLGLDGYKMLTSRMKMNDIDIPVVAIGGIEMEDIDSIMQTGVSGIAVSGLIHKSKRKKEIIDDIQRLLNSQSIT